MHKQATIFDMFIRVYSVNYWTFLYAMHKESTIVSACPATAMVTTIRHNHNLDMIYRSTIACQVSTCIVLLHHHAPALCPDQLAVRSCLLSGLWDRPPGFLDLGPSPVCPFDDSSILNCGSELRHMWDVPACSRLLSFCVTERAVWHVHRRSTSGCHAKISPSPDRHTMFPRGRDGGSGSHVDLPRLCLVREKVWVLVL